MEWVNKIEQCRDCVLIRDNLLVVEGKDISQISFYQFNSSVNCKLNFKTVVLFSNSAIVKFSHAEKNPKNQPLVSNITILRILRKRIVNELKIR